MFAFIIFHSSSLSNVDKDRCSSYTSEEALLIGSNSKPAHRGRKGSDELRFGSGYCPTTIRFCHPMPSHPVALLSPRLDSPPPVPSLYCIQNNRNVWTWYFASRHSPQRLCVAIFSGGLMLCPLLMSILWYPPQAWPHQFLLICQTAALVAPPLTEVPISTKCLLMTSPCLFLS